MEGRIGLFYWQGRFGLTGRVIKRVSQIFPDGGGILLRGRVKKNKRKNKQKKPRSGKAIRLATKWKKGFFSVLFSRFGFILILLLIQIWVMMSIWTMLKELVSDYLLLIQSVFEVLVILALINRPMNSSAKLSWTLLISAMPLSGTLFYVWTTVEMGYGTIRQKLMQINLESAGYIHQSEAAARKIKAINRESAALSHYLTRYDLTAVYDNVNVRYFPVGEDKFECMLDELEKATDFIFLEYFIIEEGYMWGRVLEILTRKAKEGVDVRVMYDGTCEFSKLPHDYPRRLQEVGIQCKVWERIKPVITSSYNYRDHRKILIIDGKAAFCGGINLADEYINKVNKFGHWKDTAIMLEGAAVDSFTVMFLQMWNVWEKDREDFNHYLGKYDRRIRCDGCVIPYAESPMNNHKIAERVYTDILYSAKDYVYIMTPYLILDDELTAALRFAAERGVDVRIILPGIPDKKLIWLLGRNQYLHLLEAGVKIYEYTSGFVHSKVFLSDNIKAVVGTINLDYRSLYHHFECAAYLVGVSCLKDIQTDFTGLFASSREITAEILHRQNFVYRIAGAAMRVIAPLL